MIKFTSKISGTQVTGSEIDEVMHNIIFASQFISLKDCIKKNSSSGINELAACHIAVQ